MCCSAIAVGGDCRFNIHELDVFAGSGTRDVVALRLLVHLRHPADGIGWMDETC